MLTVLVCHSSKEHPKMNPTLLNNGLPLDAKQILDFPLYRPENAPTPYNRRDAIVTEPDLHLNWSQTIPSPSGPLSHMGKFLSTTFRHCPKSFFEETARLWGRAKRQYVTAAFRDQDTMNQHEYPEMVRICGIRDPKPHGSKIHILLDLKRFVVEVHRVVTDFHGVTVPRDVPAAAILTRYTATNCIRDILADREYGYPRLEHLRTHTIEDLQDSLRRDMSRGEAGNWLWNRNIGRPEHAWYGPAPFEWFFRILRQDVFTYHPYTPLSAYHPEQHQAVPCLSTFFLTDPDAYAYFDNTLLTGVLLNSNHWADFNPPPEPPKNPLEDLAPEPQLIETTPQPIIDACTCPITYEIMRDPVIDPEGNSYEKLAIISALKKNPKSPITRTPLNENQLTENRALKQTIEALTVSC